MPGRSASQHDDFKVDRRARRMAAQVLDICTVERDHVGVSVPSTASTSRRCRRASTPSGRTWPTSKVVEVDLREQTVDVAGQEIMTADKVTLRMNAVVTYRVVDARQAVTVVGRRYAGAVPRGAAGAAGGGRRARARRVPDRQGRRGERARGSGPPPRAASWVWRSSRWASATSSCRAK